MRKVFDLPIMVLVLFGCVGTDLVDKVYLSEFFDFVCECVYFKVWSGNWFIFELVEQI